MSWAKNLAGCNLDEDKMARIKCPRLELTTHVTIKTVQAFSLLGMFPIGTLIPVFKGQRNLQAITESAARCGRTGAIVGLIAGPLLCYARMRKLDTVGVTDRCYRLRFNRGQVRVDRLWILGGIAGAGAAYAMGHAVSTGVILGANAGVVVAGLLLNPMLK